MMKKHKDVLEDALKNREVKEEYDRLKPEFKAKQKAIKAKRN